MYIVLGYSSPKASLLQGDVIFNHLKYILQMMY